tara:strand:+ start:573 stop:1322 length:750 start_codon:yes stop_codon:yes gene_type:complete
MIKIMFLLFNLVYSNLIELTTNNSVILRGPVNSISVSKWIYNINKIKTDDIYIYIKSPGGSVTSGNLFIEQIKSLSESGKNIHCIAEFAASMAFIILQSCPNRYGLFSSILMQHQISFGISGNLQNVNNYISHINDISYELNIMQSQRLGLSLFEFNNKVVNDWWLTGTKALKFKAIDKIISVKCSLELIEKKDKIPITEGLYYIILQFSMCPLIEEPINNDEIVIKIDNYIKDLSIKKLLDKKYLTQF